MFFTNEKLCPLEMRIENVYCHWLFQLKGFYSFMDASFDTNTHLHQLNKTFNHTALYTDMNIRTILCSLSHVGANKRIEQK